MTSIQYLGLYRHYHIYCDDSDVPYYGVNDDESYIPEARTLDELKRRIDREADA